MKPRVNRTLSTLAILALATATLPASAQTVVTGDQKVIVDGDTVRIETPEGVTVVQGDWRQAGTGDSEQILIDLGAVTVEDRIQITLDETVLFDFGSDAIRADAAAALGDVAQVIRARSVGEVYVIGHTDSIGDESYNRDLSRRRAAAVMAWLNHHEGIPAPVMVGSGMGSARPVAHNTNPDGSDSPEGRAKNRRVELQIATREGVAVGPGVVIAPGGVRVTDQGVSVAGGAIQVDESGVRVGGVEVTEEGVRVGDVTVGAEPAAGAIESAAAGGAVVRESCYEGDCRMSCSGGAACRFDCQGGDCRIGCAPGSSCEAACSGGDCQMWCEPGATCEFSCNGGDCTFSCPQGADCVRVSCFGEDCVCTGPGC